jgi:hypothetical protein
MDFLCSVRVCRALRAHYRKDVRHELMLREYTWDKTKCEWIARKDNIKAPSRSQHVPQSLRGEENFNPPSGS